MNPHSYQQSFLPNTSTQVGWQLGIVICVVVGTLGGAILGPGVSPPGRWVAPVMNDFLSQQSSTSAGIELGMHQNVMHMSACMRMNRQHNPSINEWHACAGSARLSMPPPACVAP